MVNVTYDRDCRLTLHLISIQHSTSHVIDAFLPFYRGNNLLLDNVEVQLYSRRSLFMLIFLSDVGQTMSIIRKKTNKQYTIQTYNIIYTYILMNLCKMLLSIFNLKWDFPLSDRNKKINQITIRKKNLLIKSLGFFRSRFFYYCHYQSFDQDLLSQISLHTIL